MTPNVRPLLLAISLLSATACGTDPAPVHSAPKGSAPSSTGVVATTASGPPVAANELGDVPVLMYHRITPNPASVYDRTPQDLRAELERLAGERYVPVTAGDYAAGKIDIPAGAHPVVLTFDDGDPTQFKLTAEGTPAAETAVAIIQDVAARYPEFRPVATFYVNGDPFGEPGGVKSLTWLRDHGMEIGNHTLTHANLRQVGGAAAQRDISRGDQAIRQAAPGAEPATIALPFGIHPSDPALALAGSSDGVSYRYRGVFLVGANPAPSPHSPKFDPLRIPRIRSQAITGKEAQFGSAAWLDKLAAEPGRRFTSDGVPNA
ncbi:polysaccharide deacetylase family protein [Kibdelosporangium phytohabitans]|uniref:Xylanase n=1 Tax=Kibdelosporangium phytohabitans TaxID=860235 RepID=A0A0N9IB33_9PSEU|nr:polysaccharide deacetylase family protein [Kibdelosporangium phytohabitans]ALG13371.1 xylanase [Kibdelosporangium phytohabitans]MBE1465161.1 peptidoglycan/xylan/chitin deacetylase (PgdA/CDA1 family) [Kibdelosporangium phytohabitans]